MGLGFGQIAFGRGNVGYAKSRFEPRFEESVPPDGQTNVSVYQTVITFILYCFSSRLDLDTLLVEISEDSGATFNPAYENGSFVSPYDDPESKILQIDGQRVKVYINKDDLWTNEEEIQIRVTGEDGFGNAATKETPVKWD